MASESFPGLEHLILEAGHSEEIIYGSEEHRLRIDLRIDDNKLWQSYHHFESNKINLLLACDSSNGDLCETQLSWVVGAAIRPAWVEGPVEAMELLQVLGISAQVAELTARHCPGLGYSMLWAFHLERHGWLTATPVQRWS